MASGADKEATEGRELRCTGSAAAQPGLLVRGSDRASQADLAAEESERRPELSSTEGREPGKKGLWVAWVHTWLNGHRRLSGVTEVARRIAVDAKDDRLTGLAAEVAFFALLSVFPGLLAVAAGLGALDNIFGSEVAVQAQREVIDVLKTFLTERGDGTVEAIESLFERASGGAFTLGILTALWAASRGMATVMIALSEIYDYGETRSRLRRRAVAVGLAAASMALVVLILAMLVLGPLLGAGRAVARVFALEGAYGTVWSWVGLPVAFAALLAWAAVAFHSVPHTHVGWRHHIAGAALTGALWLVVSVGFRLYLHLFGGNPVFGVLGGALVVLLWLYLLSLALLVGAELSAVMAERRAST